VSVATEFKKYRVNNKLWKTIRVDGKYETSGNKFIRILDVYENDTLTIAGEPEVFYGKNAHND